MIFGSVRNHDCLVQEVFSVDDNLGLDSSQYPNTKSLIDLLMASGQSP